MTTRTLALLTLTATLLLCTAVYRAAYGVDQPIVTKHSYPCDPVPQQPYCVHVNQPNGWRECYEATEATPDGSTRTLSCEEAERRLWP